MVMFWSGGESAFIYLVVGLGNDSVGKIADKYKFGIIWAMYFKN